MAADKGSDRWDALFASSAADPIQTQQASSTATATQAPESHDQLPRQSVEAVANSRIETTTPPEPSAAIAPSNTAGSETPNEPIAAPRTHTVKQGETLVSIA